MRRINTKKIVIKIVVNAFRAELGLYDDVEMGDAKRGQGCQNSLGGVEPVL